MFTIEYAIPFLLLGLGVSIGLFWLLAKIEQHTQDSKDEHTRDS